jgi:hypothetical protein
MKKIILVLILIISCLKGFGQDNENEKIYLQALDRYAVEMDSFYYKNSKEINKKIIYLEKPNFIDFKTLPSKIGNYKIVLLTKDNLEEIYHKENFKLYHTRIFPIEITEGKLMIGIIPYHGEMKNGKDLSLGLSDGTSVYFKYDCNLKTFVHDKTENWGI